ncbi:MAG: hypothetical protein JKY27_08000 [Magnetovibrio sp.]|nr:hypothetical protein [Magnetovibrio sp.]
MFAVLAMFGDMRAAWAQDITIVEVFIDARQDAYVVFQGVSADTHPFARQEMVGYTALEKVSLVPWGQFRDNVQDFVAAGIVKNEYLGQRPALGILAVLKSHPGRPIAITWNGGVASTFFDFQHAAEVYQAYQEDAQAYEQSRAQEGQDDPLDPARQFKFLLDG